MSCDWLQAVCLSCSHDSARLYTDELHDDCIINAGGSWMYCEVVQGGSVANFSDLRAGVCVEVSVVLVRGKYCASRLKITPRSVAVLTEYGGLEEASGRPSRVTSDVAIFPIRSSEHTGSASATRSDILPHTSVDPKRYLKQQQTYRFLYAKNKLPAEHRRMNGHCCYRIVQFLDELSPLWMSPLATQSSTPEYQQQQIKLTATPQVRTSDLPRNSPRQYHCTDQQPLVRPQLTPVIAGAAETPSTKPSLHALQYFQEDDDTGKILKVSSPRPKLVPAQDHFTTDEEVSSDYVAAGNDNLRGSFQNLSQETSLICTPVLTPSNNETNASYLSVPNGSSLNERSNLEASVPGEMVTTQTTTTRSPDPGFPTLPDFIVQLSSNPVGSQEVNLSCRVKPPKPKARVRKVPPSQQARAKAGVAKVILDRVTQSGESTAEILCESDFVAQTSMSVEVDSSLLAFNPGVSVDPEQNGTKTDTDTQVEAQQALASNASQETQTNDERRAVLRAIYEDKEFFEKLVAKRPQCARKVIELM